MNPLISVFNGSWLEEKVILPFFKKSYFANKVSPDEDIKQKQLSEYVELIPITHRLAPALGETKLNNNQRDLALDRAARDLMESITETSNRINDLEEARNQAENRKEVNGIEDRIKFNRLKLARSYELLLELEEQTMNPNSKKSIKILNDIQRSIS